jgi:hypothetical protein
MNLILDEYSLVAIYSAMSIYTLAFVMFSIDLAKRSARIPAAVEKASDRRPANTQGVIATLQKTEPEPPTPIYKFERIAFSLVVLGDAAGGLRLAGVMDAEFSLISSALLLPSSSYSVGRT